MNHHYSPRAAHTIPVWDFPSLTTYGSAYGNFPNLLFNLYSLLIFSRGGHSNRLCTNTRDRGQELGQAVKAENLEGQAVKGTSQIRKSQGSSTVKGQPDTKSHQSTIPHLVEQVRSRVKGLFEWRSSGQGPPNSRSRILTAVAGVSTESIGVTSPCLFMASSAGSVASVANKQRGGGLQLLANITNTSASAKGYALPWQKGRSRS